MIGLVDRVRRRLLGNELLAQGVNAASAALAVLILLLLLGTQVLDWYWIVLVPAVCAGIGLHLVRKRLPGRYTVAQIVDARMGLHDTISTALYFSQDGKATGAAENVCRLQAEQAERAASSVDAKQAAPFRVPHTVYVLAVLFLTAGALFALRYGLNRTLDLKPPLARMLQQQFGWNQKNNLARNDRRKSPTQAGDPDDETGKDPDQKGANKPDQAANEQGGAESAAPDQKGTKSDDQKQAGNANAGADSQEAQAEKSQDSQSDPSASDSQKDKSDQSQNGGKPNDNPNGDNSSFMSKLKDALSSLLPRTPPKGNQGQDQANQNQKGQQSSGQQQSGKDGQKSADQPGDSQDGQSGENGQDQQQDPNGKNSGKNDGQRKNKQPGSGIGSQDGDKSIKQAQQLEAMGKLSEIYGKRAANITGEATVEVQSTSQQLKTQYVQHGSQHSQAGAEIDRDVVPVSLQGYVQQYFEQLRKQAPPAAGKAAPSKNAPSAATGKDQTDKKQ